MFVKEAKYTYTLFSACRAETENAFKKNISNGISQLVEHRTCHLKSYFKLIKLFSRLQLV